jgi:gas vesicle protein
MNNERKWSDISNDIANVAKQIKSNIDDENLVGDLKDTFKTTIDNTSQLIKNIVISVEASITDEEIKKETKEIVNSINSELDILLKKTKNKFSEMFDSDSLPEEE